MKSLLIYFELMLVLVLFTTYIEALNIRRLAKSKTNKTKPAKPAKAAAPPKAAAPAKTAAPPKATAPTKSVTKGKKHTTSSVNDDISSFLHVVGNNLLADKKPIDLCIPPAWKSQPKISRNEDFSEALVYLTRLRIELQNYSKFLKNKVNYECHYSGKIKMKIIHLLLHIDKKKLKGKPLASKTGKGGKKGKSSSQKGEKSVPIQAVAPGKAVENPPKKNAGTAPGKGKKSGKAPAGKTIKPGKAPVGKTKTPGKASPVKPKTSSVKPKTTPGKAPPGNPPPSTPGNPPPAGKSKKSWFSKVRGAATRVAKKVLKKVSNYFNSPKQPNPAAPKKATPAPKLLTKPGTPALKKATPKQPTKPGTPATKTGRTPATKKATPAPKKATPAPKQPTKSGTPAHKKATPAPKQPTPAHKKPTPPPKKPTPTSKKHDSSDGQILRFYRTNFTNFKNNVIMFTHSKFFGQLVSMIMCLKKNKPGHDFAKRASKLIKNLTYVHVAGLKGVIIQGVDILCSWKLLRKCLNFLNKGFKDKTAKRWEYFAYAIFNFVKILSL